MNTTNIWTILSPVRKAFPVGSIARYIRDVGGNNVVRLGELMKVERYIPLEPFHEVLVFAVTEMGQEVVVFPAELEAA